ncbi:MAG: tRNA (N6-isopentenyl adenosine(37)-C2)-methylthiotransferase MiaB [Bacillota bacterium]|nr:tRNA (N6-isopentenyl adenosine(37)-C2)-methylthiotransferase MiaB [Bacillota bacterium]
MGANRNRGEEGERELRRYYVEAYGCQMNVHDAENVAGMLEGLGYEPATSVDDADVVVILTCCVRRTAEDRAWGRVGELARLKQRRPGVVLALGGCMTQQSGVVEEARRRAPHLDLIFGTHNLYRLPELLGLVRPGNTVAEVWQEDGSLPPPLPVRRGAGVRAWITIMYGCDNYCSYCIVPYVRGRQRSRAAEEVLREAEDAVRDGYREVFLLGQNVNDYGRDLPGGPDFAELLRRLDRIPDLDRLRYTTSHPRDFTDAMIEAVAECPSVCEHFHLPVQAGSDRILALMNRGYTRDQYLDLLRRIRARVPGCSVTTDMIVGFPGETDGEFADTLDLVRKAQFDAAFTFMFSPRRGTPAASLPGQLPVVEKKRRLAELNRLQNSISLEKNRELVGSDVDVLVEGVSERDPGYLTGRTRTGKVTVFPGPAGWAAKMVVVRVEKALTWTLHGRAVGGEVRVDAGAEAVPGSQGETPG